MIDFFDDSSGAILREVLSEHADSIPECVVKSASLIPSESFRQEKRAWAWAEQKRFALDTPEDTWLSAQYFKKTAHLIPFQHHERIAGAIAQAQAIHGMEIDSVKQASIEEAMPDEAYALVVKSASGEDTLLADYPVNSKEATEKSIQWYPRGLSGDLASYRAKVAGILVEKAEQYGLGLTDALADETRPIKASSLVDELGLRIQRIHGINSDSARVRGLMAKSASSGRSLPYEVKDVQPIDPRFIRAYEELAKQAKKEPLPKNFFTHMEELDKHAGFLDVDGLMPAAAMASREIDYDVLPAICKLAGTYVNLDELLEKVATEVWSDIAPQIVPDLHSPTKVAAALVDLSPQVQRILLTQMRGF